MKKVRDIYWKDMKLGQLKFQTTEMFHPVLSDEELMLAMSLGAQAMGDALVRILEAKGK